MGSAQNINFKNIRKLGEGGFGEVFLIEKENKHYALKKSKNKLTEKEINEIKKIINILSNIKSEYIIKYYDTFEDNNSFNILMEYAGEVNLKQFIKKYKVKGNLIEESLIKDIILQICVGLIEIHKNKIIHRDLTPDNIFIDENNKIKIGDFGISKILSTNTKYNQNRIGKYHYFAPEMEIGEKYNHKIDVYCLGCIIYELLTLKEYYLDKIMEEKKLKINVEIYDLKWIDLINKLLNKDYHKRPEIVEVFNMVKSIKQEIKLSIKVDINDINDEIYFLSSNDEALKEMNEENTELYINDKKYKFNKYFLPEKEGIYSIIIKLKFLIKDCSYMFYQCENLKSIDLSEFNTQKITNMEGMFKKCENLENINLSFFDTKNVKNMKYLFSDCYNLEKINLNSFDTTNVVTMEGMFCDCNNLKDIDLSSFNTKNVKNMNYMFKGCENLITLDLSSFNTKNVVDMKGMFSFCYNLKNLNLSSFDTKKVNNMEYMFEGNENLVEIKVKKNSFELYKNLPLIFVE